MTDNERTAARAKLIGDISIQQLVTDLSGKEFRHLVEAHMRRFGSRLPSVIAGSVELLTQAERVAAEKLVDVYNQQGYDHAFWRSDAGQMLASISCDLNDALSPEVAEPAGVFSVFQIITGNFAWMAHEQKPLRKFAGIRLGWFR